MDATDRTGPTAEQRAGLTRYLDELEHWNGSLNLTRVPRAQAERRHLDDVFHLLSVLPPPLGSRCVDVGSGGGVPGIPLALLRPDLRITLLEKDRRKCGFLVHVAGVLGLSGVEVLTERAEEAAHDPGRRELYDLALSRATAPPEVLCELSLPLLRSGGVLMAILRDSRAAATAAAAAAQACGGAVPEPISDRLLLVRKVSATPPGLPRRSGLPQRRPLLAAPEGTTLAG